MMGQNSFSDTSINSASEPTTSSSIPTSKKSPLKAIIIFITTALVGAGITTALFLLVINPSNGGPISPIQYSNSENDDTENINQDLKEFDNAIAEATDEMSILNLKLNKVDYCQFNEEYDLALASLQSIDTSSLDQDDQYRVYTYYASTYRYKDDQEQAKYYEELSTKILNETYPD